MDTPHASKIGKKEWVALYIIAGVTDITQWIIDFTVVGAGVNEAADIYIGATIAAYLHLRGVSLTQHWKRAAALVGGTIAEMATVSVLPAWIFDIWYIHADVRKEEAQIKAQKAQAEMLQNNVRQPLYAEENGVGVRKPANTDQTMAEPDNVIRPNFNGVRPPNAKQTSMRPRAMNAQSEDDEDIPMAA